ncbi:class I poly(R)-hydroxyalkanoic acid synthase [Limnobacter humi]|uniref:Class I poly(R)-hydroxyalkanoic acid synthase n=1 Tax=Limnobacter humi TaxID=1778671 RepID=A0ABT1WFD2_9BURK|nr:class I poly(R)-hydroxyalkanoic acid synthase [Limnobacter humi]
MNKSSTDFTEVLGQFFPAAGQFQQQVQSQFQEAFKSLGAGFPGIPAMPTIPGMPSFLAMPGVNPLTLAAIQPFMQTVMQSCQHALSQIPVHSLGQVQSEYAAEFASLMASAFAGFPNMESSVAKPAGLDAWLAGDKRFAASDWHDHGVYELTAALYSLNAKYTKKLVELVPDDNIEKRRVGYAIEQLVGALSPANFFATNPEAQKKLLETKGESLRQALDNLMHDLQKGRISQTDESAFEVGKNVATTPGSVIFENDYFQLIQYQATTETVGKVPMLFVPPCINKFYILDLQPDNSLVNYVVGQGHTLYLVSWKNPTEENQHFSWDGYVQDGVITAIELVCQLSKQPKINVLGFCVGGTLLGTALSTLAQRGEDCINSVTFLTTLLDFSDTGALGVFVSEEQVRAREESIGQRGLMSGKDLSSAFSSLRPNDLIWNYVVNNYLKGEKPPAFDLLYWNSDSTNLAGPMFCWYLRNTYLENRLIEAGQAVVCGEPVDLGLIDAPVYILATREDHIVPWTSAYATSQLVSGDVRFVLGASGHIAGVINPASKNKRNFWVYDGDLPESPDEWFDKASEVPGSWWKDWAAWLEPLKNGDVKAPAKLGNAKFKPIEPAPGRYVKQRV